MVKFSTYLDAETAEELNDLAECWGLPRSLLMRVAVADLVEHAERLSALLARSVHIVADTRTPAQVAHGERYLARLHAIDLEAVAAQMRPPDR
jgi:hypothetical protein